MAKHEFGIIADFEEGRWYSEYAPERYHCISVHMDLISDLIWDYHDEMMAIETYFSVTTQPGYGLDESGVTLIPPRSLKAFFQLVTKACDRYQSYELHLLSEKILQAIKEDKYLIHLGI